MEVVNAAGVSGVKEVYAELVCKALAVKPLDEFIKSMGSGGGGGGGGSSSGGGGGSARAELCAPSHRASLSLAADVAKRLFDVCSYAALVSTAEPEPEPEEEPEEEIDMSGGDMFGGDDY
eukprot:SAG31_NODE_8023_length_1539_cov_0.952778_1_plen_120_part_00